MEGRQKEAKKGGRKEGERMGEGRRGKEGRWGRIFPVSTTVNNSIASLIT